LAKIPNQIYEVKHLDKRRWSKSLNSDGIIQLEVAIDK